PPEQASGETTLTALLRMARETARQGWSGLRLETPLAVVCRVPDEGGPAVGPRIGLFELCSDADQLILSSVRGDELGANWQAIGGPMNGQRDRWLAGGVEYGSKGGQGHGAHDRGGGVVGCWLEGAEGCCWLCGGWRQQQIEPLLPPLSDTAGETLVILDCAQVIGGTVRAAQLGQRPGAGLDVARSD